MNAIEYANFFRSYLNNENIKFAERREKSAFYFYIIIDNPKSEKRISNVPHIELQFVIEPKEDKTLFSLVSFIYQVYCEDGDYIDHIKALNVVNKLNEDARLYERFYITQSGKVFRNLSYCLADENDMIQSLNEIFDNFLSGKYMKAFSD